MAEPTDPYAAFLTGAGWGDAARHAISGDASARVYLRLSRPGTPDSAILMDARQSPEGEVAAFVRVGAHLTGAGLSAPRVLARDGADRFLLLEDLGDAVFARVLQQTPDREKELYLATAEALAHLHASAPPTFAPTPAPADMARATQPLIQWHIGAAGPEAESLKTHLCAILEPVLTRIAPQSPALCLRDFHAENLIWLPGRDGVACVGILDFQDAFAGHPAYDMASLLHDARRDVGAAAARATVARYLDLTGTPAEDFALAMAACSAQRNLRILGVLTKLATQGGKPHYLTFLPRVWAHLRAALAHPELRDLSDWVTAHVPPPQGAKA